MKKVVRYDARWPIAFEHEAKSLRSILGGNLLSIHHIGSTAVRGMVAKPIIDILAEVTALAEVELCDDAMERQGYEVRGEYGIEGRRYFSKRAVGPSDVAFHLHTYEHGSPHLARHLRFRDFLDSHPAVGQEYSTLKLSLSDNHGVLVEDYVERKSSLVRRIEAMAMADA